MGGEGRYSDVVERAGMVGTSTMREGYSVRTAKGVSLCRCPAYFASAYPCS
jgi:hypothetical protein